MLRPLLARFTMVLHRDYISGNHRGQMSVNLLAGERRPVSANQQSLLPLSSTVQAGPISHSGEIRQGQG